MNEKSRLSALNISLDRDIFLRTLVGELAGVLGVNFEFRIPISRLLFL